MSVATALWNGRSSRERQAIGAIGGLALVVVAFAFVALPLERTRSRLAEELPGLRASLATMERQAEEAKRLRAMPAVSAPGATPLATLAASGELARGLPGIQASVVGEKAVVATGSDVAYGALLEWIARMQSAHGLRVETARIEALPATGRVRAELRLARS
jgi:type II secretory pathway component PulM